MIFLQPEIRSGLGEDTFWTWFEREVPESTFDRPENITNDDVILRYSTLGPSKFPKHTIACLWELYPEMRLQLNSEAWNSTIKRTENCAIYAAKRVVSSCLSIEFYKKCGSIDILPIGVDIELFKPKNKEDLRSKYKLPHDKKIGFWMGTTHQMKGFNRLVEWSKKNPEIYWIIVWKQKSQRGYLERAHNYTLVSQEILSELMNCADFFLVCGLLRPYFMVEWEAMACNLKPVFLDDKEKDFIPSENPRDDIFRLNWNREKTRVLWIRYIQTLVEENGGHSDIYC